MTKLQQATGHTTRQLSNPPRYEFRIFDHDLSAERRRLEGLATAERREHSRDEYIITPGLAEASLKLRAGELDLKLLRERHEKLELWSPAAHSELPLNAEILSENFFAPAGVTLPLPSQGPVTQGMLIEVVTDTPAMRIAPVSKERHHYTLDGVTCEYVEAALPGLDVQSIAIEHWAPSAVEGAARLLDILERPNTSYPRLLDDVVFAGFRA